jgi:sulfoxide reductase heme-binding subunit YedZ
MFLLTWHVWDKMSDHWSHVTPFGIVLILAINVLFIVRRWKENEEEKRKAKKKAASIKAKKTPVSVESH